MEPFQSLLTLEIAAWQKLTDWSEISDQKHAEERDIEEHTAVHIVKNLRRDHEEHCPEREI